LTFYLDIYLITVPRRYYETLLITAEITCTDKLICSSELSIARP